MSAPTTSPRPEQRPWGSEGYDAWREGHETTGGNVTLDRPLTDDELIGLGVDPEALDDAVRDKLVDILQASSYPALRGVGRTISGAATAEAVISALEDADDIFELDFSGAGQLPGLEIRTDALIGTTISTALSYVTFGVTDIVTYGDQSVGDAAGQGFIDYHDFIEDEINSQGQRWLDNVIQNHLKGGFQNRPVVLDLDGDGIEMQAGAATRFDVDGDGFLESTGWAGPDDGFLVVDLDADGSRGNGDGAIDQARELSFARWVSDPNTTDLEALATAQDANGQLIFDSNGDGRLTAADSSWDEFRIWRDANSDGVVQSGEMRTLDFWGISEIQLTYDNSTNFDDASDDFTLFGNTVFGTSSFVINGQTVVGGVGDVGLAYAANGIRIDDTSLGFNRVHETGRVDQYRVLDETGSAHVNLGAHGFEGAFGDSRSNDLDARSSTIGVTLNGGDGHDVLRGSDYNDVLSGDSGNDRLYGGHGDDLYLYRMDHGHLTIDNTVFLVNGVEQQTSAGLHVETTTYQAKNGGTRDHHEWVSDTHSGATISLVDSGTDTLVFGDDVGISDIYLEPEDPNYTNWDEEPNPGMSMTIRFIDASENTIADSSITIENWNAAALSSFRFAGGLYTHMTNAFWAAAAAAVGTQGDDTLYGQYSSASTWINGFGGNDTISGNIESSNFINGGSGDDILEGAITFGNPTGPAAADLYIFNEDDGNDIINGYQAGLDQIAFDIDGMERNDLTVTQSGADVLIEYDDDDSILLTNTLLDSLTFDAFVFA